jgi:hypothetical protein
VELHAVVSLDLSGRFVSRPAPTWGRGIHRARIYSTHEFARLEPLARENFARSLLRLCQSRA